MDREICYFVFNFVCLDNMIFLFGMKIRKGRRLGGGGGGERRRKKKIKMVLF